MKYLWQGAVLALISFNVVAQDPSAYVSLGPQGQAMVRVVSQESTCPSLEVDGKSQSMQLRANNRPTPLNSKKPAVFQEQVCELAIAANTKVVKLHGIALPKINAHPHKIVLLGDTGCRMKLPASFQDCKDPEAWPLAEVAQQAAAEHPDLVIHVGDYHYREHACLAGDCAHTPTGYGSDTWQLDFFQPLRPLLNAAPWIFVRGNHESCERAGQGWYRYLDPRPYNSQQNCDQPTPPEADITSPYAVSLGPKLQLIVMDSAAAADTKTPKALVEAYSKVINQVTELAQQKPQSWLVLHHPILGYAHGTLGYYSSNATLLAAWKAQGYSSLLPPTIPLVMGGHYHTFELNQFKGTEPLSLLTGFGGSALEPEFPKSLPSHFEVAPGIEVSQSVHNQHFGYTVLEETNGQWTLQQKDVQGKTRLTCQLDLQNSQRNFTCH